MQSYFVCPSSQSSSPYCLLSYFPYFLLLFICRSSSSPPLCVPPLEMDMGLPGEGEGRINALCCQINASFTKPSDELYSNSSLAANGAPSCTVPPVLPPPPAPVQGKRQINTNIDDCIFSKDYIVTCIHSTSSSFLGASGAAAPLSSSSFSSNPNAGRTQTHALRG